MMTEPVAVPEVVTMQLIELQRGIGAAQERFNAFLAGAMAALGLDQSEWRISPDGRRFVRQASPQGDSSD